MPLYEYQCSDCGQLTEVLQRLSDPPLSECPSCGGSLKKLLSAPAFQFKGSGWYVTDYARKGQAESKPAGDGSGKGGGDSAAGAGDGDSSSGGDGAKSDKIEKSAKSDKKSKSAAGSSSD